MTPARIAALEACAEALKELIRLKRIKATAYGEGAQQWNDDYQRDKLIAWPAAIAAVERLEWVGDE